MPASCNRRLLHALAQEKQSGYSFRMADSLISIHNCRVQDIHGTLLPRVDWELRSGEAWLVIGPNGGGKADFLRALAGEKQLVPNVADANTSGAGGAVPYYSSRFADSTEIVSLEKAARLIEEERELDETDYMDRFDEGRTARRFICEVLGGPDAKHRAAPLPPIAARLETLPEVKLCGVERILDRGLRYLSTGEIRRTLLCRALLSGKKLLILSDPFAGLDAQSRALLLAFFQTIVGKQLAAAPDSSTTRIMLAMERYQEIPQTITHVLEFAGGAVSFCGTRTEFEARLFAQEAARTHTRHAEKAALLAAFHAARGESVLLAGSDGAADANAVAVSGGAAGAENAAVAPSAATSDNAHSAAATLAGADGAADANAATAGDSTAGAENAAVAPSVMTAGKVHSATATLAGADSAAEANAATAGDGTAGAENAAVAPTAVAADNAHSATMTLASADGAADANTVAASDGAAGTESAVVMPSAMTAGKVHSSTATLASADSAAAAGDITVQSSAAVAAIAAPALIQMNGVNVGWNGHFVLKDVSWTVRQGEHWLIRGPNGSGKTTLLELITGDNKQVYANDVRLFGRKRGTGESIWDIKAQLGIVSYRLHVEYRMVGGTDLEAVIISGFKDSIGLYEPRTDVQVAAALGLRLRALRGASANRSAR